MKTLILSLLAALLTSGPAWAQSPSPVGVWADDRGETNVELFRCGAELCGRIVWLRTPATPGGQPQTDLHNPLPEKRSQPLLGLQIMEHLQPDGEARWSDGSIYDPSNGRTYSCYLRLLQPDVLEVKGYIGFPLFGSAHQWKRVPAPAKN